MNTKGLRGHQPDFGKIFRNQKKGLILFWALSADGSVDVHMDRRAGWCGSVGIHLDQSPSRFRDFDKGSAFGLIGGKGNDGALANLEIRAVGEIGLDLRRGNDDGFVRKGVGAGVVPDR